MPIQEPSDVAVLHLPTASALVSTFSQNVNVLNAQVNSASVHETEFNRSNFQSGKKGENIMRPR